LDAFLSGLWINSLGVAVCFLTFLCLKSRYPSIYSYNLMTGAIQEEFQPADSESWVGATFKQFAILLKMSTSDLTALVGLDVALLIEYKRMCMRMLSFICVPMTVIVVPLNYFVSDPAETDSLSTIGIGHVPYGHPYMYYVYAVMVVFQCVVVKECVFAAQEEFMELRVKWLKSLSYPRSHTVLVQGIPREQQSAKAVRSFFSKAFLPEAIEEVAMVMQTRELEELVKAKCSAEKERHEGEMVYQRDNVRLRRQRTNLQVEVDAIDHLSKKLTDLDAKIAREQERLKEQAGNARGDANSQTAFVTFKTRRDCEMAKHLRYSSDAASWTVLAAPDPTTIRWPDLRADRSRATRNNILGLVCTLGVYLSFMPFCTGTQSLAHHVNLGPTLSPIWISLAPSLGLSLFLSYLPTVLLFISDAFYDVRSSPRRQHSLQIMYFWFQVVFVLGVTVLDEGDITVFAQDLIHDPLSLPSRMAESMPKATHFYMNFTLMECVLESSYLLRYMPLAKFIMFKALYGETEAREMAEPEDQDFYGIGAKCANISIYVLIGIVFGTISPLIPVLALALTSLCCLIQSYCAVFAETGKPDLGGVFWVTQLRHTLMGNMMYCLLMIGILAHRSSDDHIPCKIACLALGYAAFALYRFDEQFLWEDASIAESGDLLEAEKFQRKIPVLKTGHADLVPNAEKSYIQPELLYKPRD